MNDIAYQNKDIASKVTGEALVGKSLAPFGLPHLKITGILPTNLPVIESNELRLDNLFILNDGSIAIIDYESDFRRENFIKYINYIARVIKRYSSRNELQSLKQIRMIVIYTADVEYAEEVFNLGGLILTIESSYLIHLNSNEIYQRLHKKIQSGKALTEEELTELMILPLTVKGRDAKRDYISKAVEIAKNLPSHSDTIKVLSGILTFSDKLIDKDYAEHLKEVFRMTQVEQLLYDEAYEKAYEKAYKKIYDELYDKAKERPQQVPHPIIQQVTLQITQEVTQQVMDINIASLIKICQEIHAPKEIVISQLMEQHSFTEETAAGYVEKYWN